MLQPGTSPFVTYDASSHAIDGPSNQQQSDANSGGRFPEAKQQDTSTKRAESQLIHVCLATRPVPVGGTGREIAQNNKGTRLFSELMIAPSL